MSDDPKPALRRLFRERRQQFVGRLCVKDRRAAERALATLIAPALAGFHAIASYAAVGDEIDPAAIEATIGPHAFPRITGKQMKFHVCEWSQMARGPLGIPQPPATAPQITPDLLLVPLLAVTLAGVRLGQGGGYYDRALAALPGVRTIGLAWDVQIADALPVEAWDQPIDFVATPTRLVDCRRQR